MSHHPCEVQHGDGEKKETSSRNKPNPDFVAATVAQHKAKLRGRLAESLRLSKRRRFNQLWHFEKRKSCPV